MHKYCTVKNFDNLAVGNISTDITGQGWWHTKTPSPTTGALTDFKIETLTGNNKILVVYSPNSVGVNTLEKRT